VNIAISIVGCFAYYPAPEEALEKTKFAKTKALGGALSRHFEHTLHWIPVCEAWNRRMQVSVYLRHGQLSDYHRMKSRILQNHLELLDHMVEDEAPREALARSPDWWLLSARNYRSPCRQEVAPAQGYP
jgi:uncharacterized protein